MLMRKDGRGIFVFLGIYLLFFSLFGTETVLASESTDPWYSVNRISVGFLKHDMDYLWSGISKEDGYILNLELSFNHPAIAFFSGVLRPNIGGNLNNTSDTSSLYAGFLWEKTIASQFYIITGINLALHNGDIVATSSDRKSLGARILLRFPLELGYKITKNHAISLFFEHKSNGYLAKPNEGMDELGLRYSYFF